MSQQMRNWNFETPDINRLVQPLEKSYADYRGAQQQQVENDRSNKLMQLQQDRFGLEKDAANEKKAQAVRERAGNLAMSALAMDEGRRTAEWPKFIATHPNAAGLDPSYHDPRTGPLKVLADAGMSQQHLDWQIKKQSAANESARLDLARSADIRAGETHTNNQAQYANMTPAARQQAAPTLGLTPGSNEHRTFLATGAYSPGEAMKLNIVPEGGSLIATDPRTGRHQTVVSGENKIDPTTKKAIDEADDFVSQTHQALGSLAEAKRLNSIAYEGATAGSRETINNALPFTGKVGSSATTQLANVITNQALSSLRATFGGNPTEGERKILMDVAGSVNLNARDREAIYTRAEQAAQIRLKINEQKAQALRGGQYYKPGGQPPAVNQPVNFAPGAQPAQPAAPAPPGAASAVRPPGAYVYDPVTGDVVLRGSAPPVPASR